ncbi:MULTISPECIES: hypothetical protein [unclassified Luteimonas]
MQITRAKASQLLNQKEMALYDESRVNGLRQLDGKAISTRITRARASRDRARDLVRRQKLSSRADTGSKRGASGAANQRSKDKAELMADILARFEAGLRDADGEAGTKSRRATSTATKKTAAPAKKAAKTTGAKAAGKVAKSPKKVATKAAKKTATKKAETGIGKKTASKKAATGIGKKTATMKAAATTPKKRAANKTATGAASTAAAKGSRTTPGIASGKAGASRSRPRKRGITPEQALAQTQALLEAKQARDQEPKPWADGVEGGVDSGTPGYQSDSAAGRAKRLHAGEVRLPAIQGSVSTRDRINQGKRDNRGNDD